MVMWVSMLFFPYISPSPPHFPCPYVYSLCLFLLCCPVSKFFSTILLDSVHMHWKNESEVAQLCPTLCDPMDCSPPVSSVHEIFQARILKWVAISFPSGSSPPRDRTQVSHIANRHFYRLSHQGSSLEVVAFPSSRGSSQPRDWTQVSRIAGKFFPSWATREAHMR